MPGNSAQGRSVPNRSASDRSASDRPVRRPAAAGAPEPVRSGVRRTAGHRTGVTSGGQASNRQPAALARSTLWDDDAAGGAQPLRARWDPVPPPESPGPRKVRPERRRSAVGWFVHHYGWRAYALPLLVALTVVAVVGLIGSSGTDVASAGTGTGTSGSVTVTVGTSVPTTVTVQRPGTTTTVSAPTPTLADARTGESLPNLSASDPNGSYKGIAAGALPPGAPFAKTGAGTFHVVPGTSTSVGDGPQHRTYTVEVENGIETAADDQMFANAVVAILSDSRSWVGGGTFTLQRVDSGTPDFRVSLTSEMTVRKPDNCGWQIQLEASCYNRLDHRVFINDARWVRGAVSYNGDLGSYRVYAINHEVGHALGYHHEPCPVNGGLAPVMMQQSWSTADDDLAKLDPGGPVPADGKVCKYNPFPFPRGPTAATAPTASSATAATTSSRASG